MFTTQEGEVDTAIVNTPRFDWATLNLPNSLTERRKVLTLELARTNSFTFAEDLTAAAWTLANVTVAANGAIAPDSALTADALMETSANAQHLMSRTIAITSSASLKTAITVYAKANGRNWLAIETVNKAGVDLVSWFDLSAGVTGTVNHSAARITSAGNGWYRCEVVLLNGSGAGTATGYFLLTTANGSTAAYVGDTTKGIYLWGLQLEIDQSFATAYVQTVAAAATRATDSLYWNFPPVPQAMMIYTRHVEGGTGLMSAVEYLYAISDGAVTFFVYNDGGNGYRSHYANGSVLESGAQNTALGETVDTVATLTGAGAISIIQSRNGAAVTSAAPGGAVALPSAWSTPKLWLNSAGTNGFGANAFAEAKIVKYADVVASTTQGIMDELRAFELGPNGDAL